MVTFSALLALCAGNSPVTGGFPSQRPVTRSFDVFFDLRLNKRLSKQSRCWWFETPLCSLWRHSLVMYPKFVLHLDYTHSHNPCLTHWDQVTHICVSKLTIIGSENGLSPDRRQAIIWTNAGILLLWPLRTNFSEILIEIYTFSFKKMHLKMSSAKWRPFCPGGDETPPIDVSFIGVHSLACDLYTHQPPDSTPLPHRQMDNKLRLVISISKRLCTLDRLTIYQKTVVARKIGECHIHTGTRRKDILFL